jgi:hypothetical protein
MVGNILLSSLDFAPKFAEDQRPIELSTPASSNLMFAACYVVSSRPDGCCM